MTGNCFVDTNVLIYFRDASDTQKQEKAATWLAVLWKERSGRLSFQVLNEYYAAVTQRLRPGLDRETAQADVRDLLAWRPIETSGAVSEGAWRIQDRYRYSWRDALILSAAQYANCSCLLTEDLQHGQVIGNLVILNPFLITPDEFKSLAPAAS